MLKITPRAPSIVVSSSGEAIAFCAASAARCSPRAFADAHHRRARVGHDRLDVGEVEVDQARLRDQIADALDALAQHVVGIGKRFVERRLLLDDLQDALVRNRDQRIDLRFEFGDAALGDLHALLAFERERFGDDRDRQRARFARDLGDHRRRAGARAAAHARGDEDEIGTVENHREIFARVFGGFASDVGFAPAPRPRVWLLPMCTVFSVCDGAQRLHVGVDGEELHAGEPGLDHAVDGVAAAAADADHFDRRGVFGSGAKRRASAMIRFLRKERLL